MEKLLNRKLIKALFISMLLVIGITEVSQAQIRFGVGRKSQNQSRQNELSYANPKEYEIAEISVKGLETLNENALVSLSGLKVGDKVRIPGEATSSAIKKLWKNGIIGNVAIYISKIEGEKVWLVIELTERPRLTRINLEGISKTQQSDLNEDLDLIRGRVLSDAVVKNAELTVKKYFIDKGYLNSKVRVVREKDDLVTNGVKLNMFVDKGPKVRINKINIIGNEAFTDSKVESKMKKTSEKLRFHIPKELFRMAFTTSPKEAVNFLTKSHKISTEELKDGFKDVVNVNFFKPAKYVRSEYKNDKDNIINFYNSRGYRDAMIVEDSIYAVNNGEINIDLHIFEGQKYYFRDIIWTGNYVYSDDQLNNVLGLEKGDVYDMELINKKLTFNPNGTDISSLYMDYGYLFFRIDPVEVSIVEDSIDVEMRIYEGEQTEINKVIIKGNTRTNDHVVLREIRTLPGQKFSRSDIIRTTRELSQLGYFNPENINPVPIPNQADGTVDIEYELEERSNDQVELSGGWGGFYGFVGTVGLSFNNFSLRNIPNFEKWRPLPMGDGQKLSLRVQANGRQFQNYSLTFTEPWLGGKKPNSLTFGVNHSVQNNIVEFGQRPGSLNLTTISLGLGKRLRWPDDYFTLSNSLSFSMYNFNNFTSTANIQLGFDTGTARNLMYTVTLARNSVDQPMYPRNGSQISLALSLTPPHSLWRDIDYDNADREELFSWVEYHKWMFDAKFYQRIVGDLVFNVRTHFGYMDTYSKDAPLGPFDRFQMGGDGLAGNTFILGYDIIGLRGYENNFITPPDYRGRVPSNDNQIRGGSIYNKYVMELRYPLSLNPSATIYLLGFVEAGNNYYSITEFKPFDVYRSAGFGARIFMPAFGLLGIDWGYGFDRIPGSPNVSGPQFHFSIGQQFR